MGGEEEMMMMIMVMKMRMRDLGEHREEEAMMMMVVRDLRRRGGGDGMRDLGGDGKVEMMVMVMRMKDLGEHGEEEEDMVVVVRDLGGDGDDEGLPLLEQGEKMGGLEDPGGPKPGKESKRTGRDLQAGTTKDLLGWTVPQQVKQEPGEMMSQGWDGSLQEFLKATQSPHLAWGNPQLLVPTPWEENSKGFPFEGAADTWMWPRGEWAARPLVGETQLAPPSVEAGNRGDNRRLKAEAPKPSPVGAEAQRRRFRQFCYLEAEGPREVPKGFQETPGNAAKAEQGSSDNGQWQLYREAKQDSDGEASSLAGDGWVSENEEEKPQLKCSEKTEPPEAFGDAAFLCQEQLDAFENEHKGENQHEGLFAEGNY
ncbi:hypothetical protein JD844_013785 [Phrynosoma platyrhinos]|uniref:Uncharacterized protein n=1 Tax=Phrynosoma platyrhinos TaxID=52577 RepID=A0ABQ7TMA4_PHRPL|nr:hypothetical protein JD844_013785 [Phrynosoma platyrhinos]